MRVKKVSKIKVVDGKGNVLVKKGQTVYVVSEIITGVEPPCVEIEYGEGLRCSIPVCEMGRPETISSKSKTRKGVTK